MASYSEAISAVADLIDRLVANGCDPAEAREVCLAALLRGQRSQHDPWDEVTPLVNLNQSEDTQPGRPRAVSRSRVKKR